MEETPSFNRNLFFDRGGQGETSIQSDEVVYQGHTASFRIPGLPLFHQLSCLSYPNIENKLFFKSFISKLLFTYSVTVATTKKSCQTTILRQEKLSHRNHLGPVSQRKMSFHSMGAKNKRLLILGCFSAHCNRIN